MAHLPRGIAPELLLSQVKNTMPYLFEAEAGASPLDSFPPAMVLRDFDRTGQTALTHFEYFRLCLSSHYLTCGTPVPTDVDNQIRLKLWPAHLPLETALEMAQLVLESRSWDFTSVSTRFTYGAAESPWQKEVLSGHLGEWFTVSCAAYCALSQYRDPLTQEKQKELFASISDEVQRHSEIFGTLWRAQDGLGCLKASASISHNFGDLDRVMDMWELSVGDPLRLEFYRLGTSPFDSNRNLRYLGRLWVAGELYKAPLHGSSMARENHRHFALRKPKCLRKSRALLLPTGPFFDGWGEQVAHAFAAPDGSATEELFEVIAALKHGWERLPQTVGYGRALYGIQQSCKDPTLKSSLKLKEYSKTPFEQAWAQEALKLMDDIPSRADC